MTQGFAQPLKNPSWSILLLTLVKPTPAAVAGGDPSMPESFAVGRMLLAVS